METTNHVTEQRIVKAVIRFFTGTDFYLVMNTLADAASNHVYCIAKDMDIDGHEAASDISNEAWNISHVMALLAELYHWKIDIDKHSKTIQQ